MVFCNSEWETMGARIKYGHNPYFNRWFSAIDYISYIEEDGKSHNPYFNRWFSAISKDCKEMQSTIESQSLF